MSEPADKRVLLLGATGTAGRATAAALVAAGHDVVALTRGDGAGLPVGVQAVQGDVTRAEEVAAVMARGCDAVVSCLASRSGAPKDAWAIDHAAHVTVLQAAQTAGVSQFVLLSAICVQKPKLEFQKAKLAFEAELMASGLTYAIVRPTAYFKSLSGQVERLRQGKPFLAFGDGMLTACKPIGDADLGRYIADCLVVQDRWNAVLPIGGPGPALTPIDQGKLLAEAVGVDFKMRRVPVALFDAIIAVSGFLGRFSQTWADRAEFARTGRYYATESMLVWDAAAGRYDADATPEFGRDTLAEHYARLAAGEVQADLGEHAVF